MLAVVYERLSIKWVNLTLTKNRKEVIMEPKYSKEKINIRRRKLCLDFITYSR